MSDNFNSLPLPRRTAKYVTDPDKMSEAGIRGMVCNPVYVGVPPYERVVSDEVWIRTAAQIIKEEGAEQFLVNMLYMLRNSMVDVVPDEAIPSDYDGPWPDGEEDEARDEDEDEDFSLMSESSPASPTPWHYPLEGLVFCSHDDSPMILLDGDFTCVSEYLHQHLGDAYVTDLITEPVLTLIFNNGHTLPLLCPDCGQSLHADDNNELLDTLNGLTIINAIWDHDVEELVLEFGSLTDPESHEEPPETLFIHLNSVRKMTCPHQVWPDNEQDLQQE
ncbi:MAG: hypothetical protein JXM69_07090 [Anaerolineae bacterium]|nr:hypothetical protein [Anaerolineae bacterium]